MKVGFIGIGSMGSILIESLLVSGALQPQQVIISNRTREKAVILAEQYPGITVADSNTKAVKASNLIFLCIKPLEFKTVIDEIFPYLHANHLIVSITSPVSINDLEAQLPAKIAKVIPSITNSVAAGASLIMFGTRYKEKERQVVLEMFGKISRTLEIEESMVRISSDIVSCGPAFISFLLQKFIDAAIEETGISRENATFLTSEMIIGLAALLSKGAFDLPTLQEKVCVPGGITGAGIVALEQIDDIFNQLFKNTQEKYEEDLKELNRMFYGAEG